MIVLCKSLQEYVTPSSPAPRSPYLTFKRPATCPASSHRSAGTRVNNCQRALEATTTSVLCDLPVLHPDAQVSQVQTLATHALFVDGHGL
ncbi:hypothetical protein BDR03DRAFT_956282 [Suillus americanus]|nr:hypothetical protein BDR03DRAFT_956282 [Suillus americanus]